MVMAPPISHSRSSTRPLSFFLALLLCSTILPSFVASQTVSPTSSLPPDALAGTDAEIQIAVGYRRPDQQRYRLTYLSLATVHQATPLISGAAIRVSPNSTLSALSRSIAFVSCDSSSDSNSSVIDTIINVVNANPYATVLYSNDQSGCNYAGGNRINPQYWRLFTMTVPVGNTSLFSYASDTNNFAFIASKRTIDANASTTDNGSNGPAGAANNNGPSPSTAVAMIILYSITGVITALFLIIIVTGAIRAHRHPERYGPRNALGRPRQSRARGLARAMLETLPIVKFGERDETKPNDVELAGGATAEAKNVRDSTVTDAEGEKNATSGETADISQNGEQSATRNTQPAANVQPDEALGCSICTDDFEIGQDVRVLPCDHHFHPACIDPWLLNVSGTCPLCRIDLRPAPATDDAGNPISESETFPPPLDPTEQARRASRRHSLIWDVLNPSRMRDASAQERIAALRRVREERRMSQTEETEARRRRRLTARLQDVFHIRTAPTSTTDEGALAVPPVAEDLNTSQRSSAIERIPEVSTEAENGGNAATSESAASDWPVSRSKPKATTSSPLAQSTEESSPSPDAISGAPASSSSTSNQAAAASNKDEK